jgi:type 2 lantibiotic biosynthesis protein LanM
MTKSSAKTGETGWFDAPEWRGAWLRELKAAFEEHKESITIAPEKLENNPHFGFLYLVEPVINYYNQRLQEDLRQLIAGGIAISFDPERISNLLIATLIGKFTQLIRKPLILELNVARMEGRLEGEDSQRRFLDFVETLRDKTVSLNILREYPVLARRLIDYGRSWYGAGKAFFQHLCDDWPEILKRLNNGKDPGRIDKVQMAAGDPHRGGRTVNIIFFKSGLKLVYKPKSLAVDNHFQELLKWLNEKDAKPGFLTLNMLDRGDHGWVEFIEHGSCRTQAEVKRFYLRLGGYLAILYALQATDFHYENIIASGEHPFLIDLESFFTPQVNVSDERPASAIARALYQSVLASGLLPRRLYLRRQDKGVDISGMSEVKGEYTPLDVFSWEDEGSDEMKGVFKRLPMKGGTNRPLLKGNEVSLFDYSDDFSRGFTRVYRLFLQHRQELAEAGGPLDRFKDDEIRVILRMTMAYTYLIERGAHPDIYRNRKQDDRHWDHLEIGLPDNVPLKQLLPAERDALRQGDIPMFTTTPSSLDLWWDRGQDQKVNGFFKTDGLTRVKETIARFSEEDQKRQLWFIRASLSTLNKETAENTKYEIKESFTGASKERLVEAAKAVGDRLKTIAFREESLANWIGLRVVDDDTYDLSPMGIDLYSGLSGQALFLGFLGEMTGDHTYTRLARESLNTLRGDLPQLRPVIDEIGAFNSLGGIFYVMAHLGRLWQDDGLHEEAQEWVAWLEPLVEKDVNYDIISGSAGCIAGLLSLYRCKPSEKTLAAAVQCGEHLLKNALDIDGAAAWKTPYSPPLTGFSHGSAGIARALMELAHVSGVSRFYNTALDALAFERSHFLPDIQNWADRRHFIREMEKESGKRIAAVTWCHGAPGIGLSRFAMAQWMKPRDKEDLHRDIRVAMDTTLASGFGMNHSLCHGDLGNLEVLLQAVLHPELAGAAGQWKEKLHRLTAGILDSIDRHGWICGVAAGTETPGLMTGITGIGCQLLRLAYPHRVPAVLLLQPPQ